MSRVPPAVALAGGLRLSSLRRRNGLAGNAWAVDLWIVSPPDLGDCRNDFRQHAQTARVVVSDDLACDQPEERRQRDGPPAGSRVGELSDSVDVASQASAGHGSTRA